MAANSNMLPLGTSAPDFQLPEVVNGKLISLASFKSKSALLVMFICRHCPYVVHIQNELARIGRDYAESPLGIVAISSNDVAAYPMDSPEHLCEMARDLGFNFPVCYDESQDVARAYDAACTPDFYLFDASRALVYRGQLDSSRPRNTEPVTGADLRSAIDALLRGDAISPDQKPSVGCSIKWKNQI